MKRRFFSALAAALVLALATGCGGASQQKPAEAPRRIDELTPDAELIVAELDGEETRRLEIAAMSRALDQLDTDPASLDIVADLNMRPIRFWFARGPSGMRAVTVIGHAEAECCALMSGLIQEVALGAGFEDAWSSYGLDRLTADTPQEQERLKKLLDEVTSKAEGKACQGQVTIRMTDTDVIDEGSQALSALGQKAYERATALGRPLLLWSRIDDHPRLVPALARDGDTMKPLRFSIKKSELAIPEAVQKGLSRGGMIEGIAALEERIRELGPLAQSKNLVLQSRTLGWSANYRDDAMEPAVVLANEHITAAQKAWQGRPVSHPMRAGILADLRRMAATNATALTKIRALPKTPTSDVATKIEYMDVAMEKEAQANLEAELAEAKTMLARLQIAIKSPISNPERVLVDALLRGWPATFSKPEAESAFDNWAFERQKPVWEKALIALAAKGVHLKTGEGGAPVALTLSNVIFRVQDEGAQVAVTPYFVLAGPIVQVADPAAGIVRYEATTTDQNLVDTSKGDEP